MIDPLTIPLDVKVAQAEVDAAGCLELVWAHDRHQSRFDPAWLRQNDYAPEAVAARQFKPTLWDTSIADKLPEASYESIMADDEGLLAWLRLLRRYGFSIVRGAPPKTGTVAELAQRIAFLRETNFGVLFDVVSKPDPNSLAYTSVKLNAHTDLVSREAQPGLQFLHCLVFDADGGESILVDGFAAAEELGRRHPADYELLTNTPVRFRYQDKVTDITFKSPMIRLDAEGNYFEIRYSTALLAPLDIAPDLVKPFYRAYFNFSTILRDPKFELKFKMKPGDVEVFDNRRVLHGRDEFNPQSGPRHLEGCYLDTDDYLSRLRVLERQG
jgi:gamma-butyrobetaine dioxygenase